MRWLIENSFKACAFSGWGSTKTVQAAHLKTEYQTVDLSKLIVNVAND